MGDKELPIPGSIGMRLVWLTTVRRINRRTKYSLSLPGSALSLFILSFKWFVIECCCHFYKVFISSQMDQLTESVNTKSRDIFQKDEELKKVRLEMEILEDTEVTVKRVIQEYQVSWWYCCSSSSCCGGYCCCWSHGQVGCPRIPGLMMTLFLSMLNNVKLAI